MTRQLRKVCSRWYLYAFSTLSTSCVWGGGSPKGLVHILLVQLITMGSSKLQAAKAFFCMLTTHNDHPRYVKHA